MSDGYLKFGDGPRRTVEEAAIDGVPVATTRFGLERFIGVGDLIDLRDADGDVFGAGLVKESKRAEVSEVLGFVEEEGALYGPSSLAELIDALNHHHGVRVSPQSVVDVIVLEPDLDSIAYHRGVKHVY